MNDDFLALAIGAGATPSNLCLTDLETVIERGQVTFIEVGRALMEIRDRRLYRETHATFEAYCQERWGWGRNYANKTIRAAQASEALGTSVPIPKTEGEARAMLDAQRKAPPVPRDDGTAGSIAANIPRPQPRRDTTSDAYTVEVVRRKLTSLRDEYGTLAYWRPVWDAIDALSKEHGR